MSVGYMHRERLKFLSQAPESLRKLKGERLYDELRMLGLNFGSFFKACGVNLEQYCAEEFGIDLRDITVERFFQSDPGAKWLFPTVVREAVIEGMRRRPVFPELIVRDERVDGISYDVPYVEENVANEELRTVAEGAAIPESEVRYGDRTVKLDKKGRGIVASYEAIRRMSINLLQVHLQRIGERLGRNLDARLATVLITGDSSGSSTASDTVNTATAGAWVYGDIVKGFLELTMDKYFTPTHMLANKELTETLLNLDEFKDGLLFSFAAQGKLPNPLGVKLVPLADQPANKLTILDRHYAVEKVTEQDVLVESDKLINQQWDRSYVTVVTDFAVVYKDARVVVQSDWT